MTQERTALALPDEATFRNEIEAINRFQNVVHANLIQDQDYGVIPGTQKATLLKPGAEKIAKLLGLADTYVIEDKAEDWDKPFFHYTIRCRLIHLAAGVVVSEGLGECNSMESKYRWRESQRYCPQCGVAAIVKGKTEYGGGWLCFGKKGGCGAKWPDGAAVIENQMTGRVANEDIYSQVNTLLKMAKKRALVDAALSAGRLSNVFTQDIEDLEPERPQTERPVAEPKGVGTAVLEKLQGEAAKPRPEGLDVTGFWRWAKEQKLIPEDVVEMLGKNVKEWLAGGKTFEDARTKLIAKMEEKAADEQQ